MIGEGERAFPEVLARLETGRSLEGIEGVITAPKATAVPVTAPSQERSSRSAELPMAAHEFCGYRAYIAARRICRRPNQTGMSVQMRYCIYPNLEGRRYRLRPPEAVVEEVETVATRSKVRDFFFVDSVFNDPRSHALAICHELRRRRLPARWSAFCNPTGFDAELAHAMKEGGCNGVEFGLDVASDKMLAALDKPFGQEETRIALQAAHDAGLPFADLLVVRRPRRNLGGCRGHAKISEQLRAERTPCLPPSASAFMKARPWPGSPCGKAR